MASTQSLTVPSAGLGAGGLSYYDGTKWVVLGAGVAGQVLVSGGAGAPVWTNANVVAGAANLSGTFAARPAAGVAGRTYDCTNFPYSYYDDGVSWLARGPVNRLVDPPTAGWTNIATATKTTSFAAYAHGLSVSATDFAGTEDWRMQVRSPLLATPYTVFAHCHAINKPVANNSHGLVIRNSTTGLVTIFSYYSTGVAVDRFQLRNVTASNNGTSPTWSLPAAPFDIQLTNQLNCPGGIWLGFGDDGTNVFFMYSVSGKVGSFKAIAIRLRATFLTPDQIGYTAGLSAVFPAAGGQGFAENNLDSWQEVTGAGNSA